MKYIQFLFISTVLCCLHLHSFAQKKINIRIQNPQSESIPAASVLVNGIFQGVSNDQGSIEISMTKATAQVAIIALGYKKFNATMNLVDGQSITLQSNTHVSEEVMVMATRQSLKNPGSYSMIGKEEIARNNVGQDLPYFLNMSPATVISSDGGVGVGYTNIRIRGTDPTRTNLSINGIPLNDAESQGTFTVNIPDFASSIENMQIQRGVGSSSNGAGAFGAAINIQTDQIEDTASAELNITHGAFDAWNILHNSISQKYTAKVNTGTLGDHWNFSARLSKIASDGFIDNSDALLHSFFGSARYSDEKHLLQFNLFTGREKTFLAWNGVPQDSLQSNRRFNPIAADYEDQYDQYQQDHFQLFETYQINQNSSFNVGLHYTHGEGFFQEFRRDQTLSNYGVDTSFIGGDTITNSDILRRRWLRNDFYGIIYNYQWQQGKIQFIFGGAANIYDGEHFGEIIWASVAQNISPNQRYYTGYGDKREWNNFAKVNIDISEKLGAFVDLQFRQVRYEISGITKDLIALNVNNNWNFFNPKIGFQYNLNNNMMLFANFGVANKEPNRDDIINAAINGGSPSHESLYDWELGWKKTSKAFAFEIIGYYMQYKNQLVLTGEVNNVGEYLRINTPESFRRGIEISANYHYSSKWSIDGSLALSQNKIENFTEYLYNYDDDFNFIGIVNNNFSNTDIGFSPNVIGSARLRYQVMQELFVNLENKYVGRQYLDNTQNVDRSLDPFLTNDISVDYLLRMKRIIPQCFVSFRVNNLFDQSYEPNGYTFSYLVNNVESRNNFYYPQAGRNYLLSLNFKF